MLLPLRRRVALLLLLVVIVGSPWAQRPVLEFYAENYEDSTLRWLTEVALFPGWEVSSEHYFSESLMVVNDISVLLLLAGLVFFASRFLAHRPPTWGRCLAVGVLASGISGLLGWFTADWFVPHLTLSADVLLKRTLPTALVFGLAAGVLLAFLAAGPPGIRAAMTAHTTWTPVRRKKGERGMAIAQTTQPVAAHMPVGSEPGDVNRYLCAAAYVDERFADRVVEEIVADEAGAVAASPGVDLASVARHCLTAQDLRHRRDLRLTGAFAVVAVLAPLWLVVVPVLLSFAQRGSRSKPSLALRGQRQPKEGTLASAAGVAVVAVVFAFYIGVGLSALPLPGFPSWLLGAYLAGVPAVLASVGAAVFAYTTVVRHDLDIDRLLRTTLTREAFARQFPPPPPARNWLAERLAALREAQDGNVTVYSGYTPFIGFAAARSTWSLAVPLLPTEDPVDVGARRAEPEAFTVAELVDDVRGQLRATAARGGADGTADADERAALDSLVIEDRVFVNGTCVADDERFTHTTRLAPVARVPDEAVREIMLHPTGTVRHCLAVHVPLWGGDVVPSVFLHFSTDGRTLHLHCNNHVLGPVAARYHVVDRLGHRLTPDGRRGLMVAALSRAGATLLAAPFRALRHARFESRHNRRMVDELTAMEQDPVYDYGARLSVRELALSPDYHNYFQVVDAGRITSMVERHTLAAIRAFLDAHGYDTTDFRSQQQTILNQGLIQQGGTSIIGNQAIGAGARATQHVAPQADATVSKS